MTQVSRFLFTIDRTSNKPIFEQLCEAIREQARTGVLQEGMTLPATRRLAEDLGIARSTVITTYEQLVAEGYIEGHRGSGYTLCSSGSTELSRKHKESGVSEHEPSKLTQSLSLTPGTPDMRLFPYRQWAKTVARVCRTKPETMLNCTNSFGNYDLRKAIVEHLREWRGLDASPNQVIVTAGATDALNICFQTLADTGDSVGIEDPGYTPITRFVRSQGLKPVLLDIDEEGTKLPANNLSPTVVVLTPSHQYPLGGVMSPNRRQEYISWANKSNSWIVEDDYDSEFRYSGRPIPALASSDFLNRTIYIGSFSKIFSNTLRLGYIVAPTTLVDPIKKTMDDFGLKAGLMPQQALAEFMMSGDYYRHLRRVRKIYNERREFLVKSLKEKFTRYGEIQDHPAGMQLVFHLNVEINDIELSDRANNLGLILEPLSKSTTKKQIYNGLILGFCSYSDEEIHEVLNAFYNALTGSPSD